MVTLETYSKATCASVAVEIVFSSSNSTDPTLFTVKNLFPLIIIVKQVADGTEVPSKLDSTFFTCLLALLYGLAFIALYFGHFMPVDLVVLLRVSFIVEFRLIVTHSTGKELQASRTPLLASAFVVLAAHVGRFWNFSLFFLYFTFHTLFRIFVIAIIILLVFLTFILRLLFNAVSLVLFHFLLSNN